MERLEKLKREQILSSEEEIIEKNQGLSKK